MTPEERLRRLRESEQWNFQLQKRQDAIPARREWSPLVVSLATIAAVAVVGVVVFSAFGLGIRSVREPALPLPSPSATASASASPSPTPTAAGQTVPVATAAAKPAQLFGGDCSTIFTEAEMSAVVGEPMQISSGGNVTSPNGGELVFAIQEAGGVDCYWGAKPVDGVYSSTPLVTFVAVPTSAVPPLDEEHRCGSGFSEGTVGPGACGIEHEVDGIRFSGAVRSSTDAKGLALSAAVLDRLDERAAAETFTPTPPVDGAWKNPVDCAALADAIDVSAVFGADGDLGEDGLGHGSYGPPVGRDLTSGYESLTCTGLTRVDGDIADVYSFGILGGGAWVRDELGKSTPIDVPGIGEAYLWKKALYVFTGPNLITLAYNADAADDAFLADAAPKLRALIAALEAQ